MKENSFFSNQSGQSLLLSLKKSLKNISSIEKKINDKKKDSLKKHLQQNQTQKISEFQIKKIESYEVQDSKKVPNIANNVEAKLNFQQ